MDENRDWCQHTGNAPKGEFILNETAERPVVLPCGGVGPYSDGIDAHALAGKNHRDVYFYSRPVTAAMCKRVWPGVLRACQQSWPAYFLILVNREPGVQ